MIINIPEPIKFSIGNETGDEKYYFEQFAYFELEYTCTRTEVFYEFEIHPKVIYPTNGPFSDIEMYKLYKILESIPGVTESSSDMGFLSFKQSFKQTPEYYSKIDDDVWKRVVYYLNQYKMHIEQFEKISNTVGFGDGPLCDSVYQLAEALIDACSDLIKDKHSWIPWFVYDNEFGKRKFGANFASGKEIRVETLDDLRRVIEEE